MYDPNYINVAYEAVPLDGKFYVVIRNMDTGKALAYCNRPWDTLSEALACAKQAAAEAREHAAEHGRTVDDLLG